MASLPIPLDVLRTRLRVEVESDDTDLATLCIAAGEIIARETGLALTRTTYTASIVAWRDYTPKIQPDAVGSTVTYQDDANVTQTLPASQWYVTMDDEMPVLHFDTTIVPKLNTQPLVYYTAGYAQIPHSLQQCIVALVGSWYNNPEASNVASLAEVPLSYRYILSQYSARSPLR